MNFDLTQFVGMTGIPLIEQLVQYLKMHWRLPSYLAPLAALIFGVLINVGIASQLGMDLLFATYIGLFTGFGTSFWHEIAKKPSQPSSK